MLKMRVSVMELGRFTAGTGRQPGEREAGNTSLSSTTSGESNETKSQMITSSGSIPERKCQPSLRHATLQLAGFDRKEAGRKPPSVVPT